MNKRRFIRRKRNQLRLMIAIVIIGSFGASAIILGLTNWFIGEGTRYGDEALAIGLINLMISPAYILPIVSGYELAKKLWKKGNRRINKIAKDMLD